MLYNFKNHWIFLFIHILKNIFYEFQWSRKFSENEIWDKRIYKEKKNWTFGSQKFIESSEFFVKFKFFYLNMLFLCMYYFFLSFITCQSYVQASEWNIFIKEFVNIDIIFGDKSYWDKNIHVNNIYGKILFIFLFFLNL